MIEVYINGVLKEGVKFNSLTITDKVNQSNDTATFTMQQLNGTGYRPVTGDEVQINVDSVPSYGGVIIAVEQTTEAGVIVKYVVSCNDYTHYLNRKIITEKYEDTNAQEVILDLLDKYADDYGFTGTNVGGTEVSIKSIVFSGLTFSECLDKLAKMAQWYWYVDYAKDLHFIKRNTELAPFNLTDTSDNYIFDSLSMREDFSQIRNKVTVVGDKAVSDTRTQTIVASANLNERKTMPLVYEFASEPIVSVNGVPLDAADVGADYLEVDTGHKVMWSFPQKYLRWIDAYVPAAADIVTVTGEPLRPLIVSRQNDASILEHGLYEFVITDTSIKTRSEAMKRAVAELQAYADEVREGTFQTYEAGLRSGQTITINSPLRDIAETFIIQEVKFRQLTPTKFLWQATLATTKTLNMLDFLQSLLLSRKIVDGDDTTITSSRQLSDTFSMDDSVGTITVTTSEDYRWEQNNPLSDSYANPIRWNMFTWTS